MKRVVSLVISVVGLCLLLSCDNDKDQYAGLADIVAERQEIRKSIAKENLRKKNQDNSWEDEVEQTSGLKKEAISTEIVYEKQIEIRDSESNRPLAKGVAFMNRSGQIVKIKVYRK